MTTRPATAADHPQLDLPGQTHVAQGPHDQTGMYVMHHAFRRDLVMFAEAAAVTPADDREVWRALSRRWPTAWSRRRPRARPAPRPGSRGRSPTWSSR